jgi:tRNA pseudouridine13 synthase
MSTDDSDQLPYATAKSLRVLGKIRQQPQDFKVEEIAAYEPAGHGEHVLLHVEKTGLNTPEAVRRVARALDADPAQAGWAGLKDRNAVTSQWISLFQVDPERALRLELPGIRVLSASRHPHKIRTGHLKGNRFVIRIVCAPQDIGVAQTVLQQLSTQGTPNYYGEQRFGRDGENLPRARRWLADGGRAPRDRFDRKLLASVLQSDWFNQWLAARVRADALGRPITGDLMRKEETGGMFVTQDADDAAARMATWDISPTGPIFGEKMRWPEADALEIERALWARVGLSDEALSRARKLLPGSRRSARMRPAGAQVGAWTDGIELAFTLPKGAYATVVLRELFKTAPPEAVPEPGSESEPELEADPGA